MNGQRILIVGSGIAGLTLAAGLARIGVAPTVVELANTLLTRGLGLFLSPNALLALRRIGLDRALVDRSVVLERARSTDASEVDYLDRDLRPTNDRYAPTIGIDRARLMEALKTAVRSEIRFGVTVEQMETVEREIRVAFSDGSKGTYDLVVGADGLHSKVRQLVFTVPAPVYRSHAAWRTIIERVIPEPHAVMRDIPGARLGTIPVGADRLYVFLLVHHPQTLKCSREEHLQRFRDAAAVFRGTALSVISTILDPEQVIYVPVFEVAASPFHHERVLLIGDAAHAITPLWGQGAAMAMEDAVVLTELVRDIPDIETVLNAYERRRRDRVDFVRAQSRHYGVARGLEGVVTPELLERYPPRESDPSVAWRYLIQEWTV